MSFGGGTKRAPACILTCGGVESLDFSERQPGYSSGSLSEKPAA